MGRLIAVTSGKGGVGKSNVSVRLAEALSAEKNKTLLIDLDAGMRCLDLLLGVTDSLVFDLGDILENEKAPEEVILNTKNSNIDLIAAPLSGSINADKFGAFLKNTALEYDFIILDFPAGVVDGLYAALPKYTEVLVVCNADAVSVRDAAVIGKALNKLKLLSVRLILNRADFKFMKQGMNANIDEVIDRCGIRLIAVIPQSMDIYFSSCKGEPLKKNTKAAKAFGRLAKRILGYDIPFQTKKL